MPSATPVRNPRTGENDFSIEPYGREDVEREAAHVRANQPVWAADLDLRIATLEAWKNELVKARGDIAEALTIDTGRRALSYAEVDVIVGATERWCRQAPELLKPPQSRNSEMPGIELSWAYSPYPVVAIISPWNFPTHSDPHRRRTGPGRRLRRHRQGEQGHPSLRRTPCRHDCPGSRTRQGLPHDPRRRPHRIGDDRLRRRCRLHRKHLGRPHRRPRGRRAADPVLPGTRRQGRRHRHRRRRHRARDHLPAPRLGRQHRSGVSIHRTHLRPATGL